MTDAPNTEPFDSRNPKNDNDAAAFSVNRSFVAFLKTWHTEAAAQNAKIRFALRKAIASLEKYPAPLPSAAAAAALEGIGPVIIARFEAARLKALGENALLDDSQTKNTQGLQKVTNAPKTKHKKELKGGGDTSAQPPSSPAVKKQRRRSAYVPHYRSGAFALLCALADAPFPLAKVDVVRRAQPLCDASFTEPHRDTHFTAWCAMKTLEQKGLVMKSGHPPRYELADEGKALALRLRTAAIGAMEPAFTQQLSLADDAPADSMQSLPAADYEIVCIVDVRECGGDAKTRGSLLQELRRNGVPCITEALAVGDFLWVARSSHTTVVLDCIVERKRHDDFVASLVSGRFADQRFRLAACGVERVFVLLEAHRSQRIFEEFGVERAGAAIASMQVSDAFCVLNAASMRESAALLLQMHAAVCARFAGVTLNCCVGDFAQFCHVKAQNPFLQVFPSFAAFQSQNTKSGNLTLRDVFVKQLLNMRSMTLAKAFAITSQFPTPAALHAAFEREAAAGRSPAQIVSTLSVAPPNRTVGAKLAAELHGFFCGHQADDAVSNKDLQADDTVSNSENRNDSLFGDCSTGNTQCIEISD